MDYFEYHNKLRGICTNIFKEQIYSGINGNYEYINKLRNRPEILTNQKAIMVWQNDNRFDWVPNSEVTNVLQGRFRTDHNIPWKTLYNKCTISGVVDSANQFIKVFNDNNDINIILSWIIAIDWQVSKTLKILSFMDLIDYKIIQDRKVVKYLGTTKYTVPLEIELSKEISMYINKLNNSSRETEIYSNIRDILRLISLEVENICKNTTIIQFDTRNLL